MAGPGSRSRTRDRPDGPMTLPDDTAPVVPDQLIADASGLPVETGPTECTAIGNALVQYAALEELANAEPLRRIVRKSFPCRRFEPDSASHARMQAAMARARR